MNDTMTSSKPYLIRAIYEWILDNRMTPHLVVDAGFPDTRVPREFVADGRIVFNIAPGAVRGLVIGNEWIEFGARFNGVAREVLVPTESVVGIFTRENGQGMVFPDPTYPKPVPSVDTPAAGPRLAPLSGDGKPGDSGGRPSPDHPKGRKGAPTLKVVK
ncbi:ClpXP protease specificity-enhancing factor [Thermochromatium tepidum]|jgi:Stringent starvation protein B|uniref:ClpXP protease specificity-enhancing factor n=1 Tax=Thermochromatium tepidum ATCC 43061 TaxID=316276 RepID=A0A6I6ED17_THETI|nr:ClpXP protease specificity-enhancing factor [Thermochromatium tepidum]QGU33236.1 ClpXP protease specificity-enhancing factor [Thermochromatium tepidum ATCC 43061]